MKPFVLISTRPEDDVAARELESVRRFTGLAEEDLRWVRLERGVGALGTHQGARIDRTYGEELAAIDVTLTEEGREDPLVRAAGLPDTFTGLVGHKEAVHTLPASATVLATGTACPVQMFRIGTRQYATQFHPEMDVPLLLERAARYREHGYSDPAPLDAIFAARGHRRADEAPLLLRGFAEHFAR